MSAGSYYVPLLDGAYAPTGYVQGAWNDHEQHMGPVSGLLAHAIERHDPRPDLALKFINFMLEGRNSAELTNLIGSGNPNRDAMKYIKPALLELPAVFPPPALKAKLEQLKDLTIAQRRLRNKLWTEIKASK